MKAKFITTIMGVAVLGLGGAGLYFYNQNAQAKAAEDGAGGPPQGPMPVQAEIVKKQNVKIWKEFSGRLSAVDYAEIRPQVSGNITDIRFKDGQSVEKGDILYVIDPRPYEADVEMAKALLSGAQNTYEFAQKEFQRAQGLIKTKALSERVFDERSNAAKVAKASVEGAKAQLIEAEINLDHAYVKAPISGRVSRAEITLGNLVEAGPNAPILTSIVSNNGVYADFEVDEQTYLAYIRSGAKNNDAEKSIPVRLRVGSGDKAYDGFIYSFDNRIDPSSGTIRARALFENEDDALLPGMFARIEMGSAASEEHILLTERAIGTNQNRKFVYVLDENNIVTYRPVKIGNSILGNRIIEDGLNEGETVITDGIIKIFPGMPVTPKLAEANNNSDVKKQ